MTWNAQVDASTVYAFANEPTKAGVFKVKVGTSEQVTSNAGNPRVKFTSTVMEGEFKGCQIDDGLNLEPWDKVRGFWGMFLVSTGVPRTGLKAAIEKNKGLSPKLIDNKVAYVRFEPADREVGKRYAKKDWVPAVVYEAWTARQAELAASGEDSSDESSNGTGDSTASFMDGI
jgi:hypothetical protein